MATFHSTLDGSLATDFVAAAVGIVDSTADVYFGRARPQVAKTGPWVWVERDSEESVGTGAETLELRRYRVHIYGGSVVRGSAADGAAQVITVDNLAEKLVRAYSGSRRMYSSVPAIKAIAAEEEAFDADPESDQQEAVVRLTFLIDSTAAP